MSFLKGQSGNPAGRKKGSKNKIRLDIKGRWKQVLENQIENIESDLASMAPQDRAKILLAASEFITQKNTASTS